MNRTSAHTRALAGAGGWPGSRGGAGRRLVPAAVLAGFGLLLAGGVLAPPAPADTVSERKQTLDRQLEDLRESLEGTSKSLVDAAVNLKRAQSEMVDANAKLASARAALTAATTRDRALAGRLALAEAAVAKAGRELAARQEQEAATRRRLGSLAREAYVNSGLSGLSIALDAQNPEQFADRVSVAGTALRRQNSEIARIEVQQADTRARQSRLAAAEAEVAELKRLSGALVTQRRRAESAAGDAAAQVRDLVALKARSVRTIEARKSAERRRIAALQARQDQLAKLLRARARAKPVRAPARSGGGQSSRGSNSAGLSYPVNAPITSPFGYRFHPILRYSRLHGGTDFGAGCGTPVRAAGSGTVIRSGSAGGYGNQIVIAHGRIRGKDIASSYNHLSRFVVRSGNVRRGQLIGYVGTTGLSTGCHLHFEVYSNGTHVNPMSWL